MATLSARSHHRLTLVVVMSFFIMALLSLGSVPAHAAISYVSASHAVCTQTSSGTSSQTCTLPASTTAGDDVVVGVAWENTGTTVSNVRGSGATSYFFLYGTVCNAGNDCVATLVCHKCAAQTAVTTTMSEGAAFVTTVEEYAGVQALGITGTKTGSSANPGLTLATGDASDWTVCATASLGSASPTAGSGNVRSASSTGAVAGAIVDNTASAAGSVSCTDTVASGAWAAAGIELRSVAPRTYIWPDCDTTHPCVVHHVDTVAVGTAENEKPNPFKLTVQPSGAGNLLTFTVTHVSSKTVTISDNNSGKWQSAATTTNASDEIETEVRYVCGAAGGTNVITIQLSAPPAPGEVLQFSYNEVSGIAAASCLDGAGTGANGLTGALQPGTLNTSAAIDLIYNFAEESYNYPRDENPIGWIMPDDHSALLTENTSDKFASQVSVQAAAGAYSPVLYVNADPSERNWNSVAAAFKASSGAGTQPSGIHVTRVMHFYNNPLPLNPATIPFPSTGNAIVITSAYPSSSYEGDMANLTDNQGDTWTRTPFKIADDDPQVYYTCFGAVAGGRDLTIDFKPDTGITHMVLYEIAGAKTTGGPTGCVGNTVESQTGNQPSSTNASIMNAPVITPQAANSVVFAVNMLGFGPPSGTLTPGVIFSTTWATGMTDATNFDSGDCYAYDYTSSTNPIAFNWQMANSFDLPNGGSGYDAAAIEILPSGSAATGPTTETLSVTNSPVVYTGSPQAAVVTASVAGTVSNVLYNGSATVPTSAGTYPITANFTPTDTTDYKTLTAASAGNFAISKATPAVTLSSSLNPSTSGSSVTFKAAVPSTATGTVTFYNGSTSLGSGTLSGGSVSLSTSTLPAGSNSITAVYGGDGNNNSASSGILTQSVNSSAQTKPTITWATPAPITYGTALSSTQLDATASVAGTSVYSPQAGTVLSVGSHTLTVTFTPTDTTHYTTATGSVVLVVQQNGRHHGYR